MRASRRRDHVLKILGIEEHQTKGVRGKSAAEPDHLGIHISIRTLSFTVTASMQTRLKKMTDRLLRPDGKGSGMVSAA